MAARFIAIEGGEGAGKGVVTAELSRRLTADGYDVLATREPGGTAEGQALRDLLLASSAPQWEPWAELLLMVAARVQHVRRLILPALRAARWVICDRFIGSTIAYQGAGRGIPAALIDELHHAALDNLQPDLTIVLDIDPAIGLRRSLARLETVRLDEDRFERLDHAFHDRVRNSFLRQAHAAPDRHVVIDASQPIEHVLTQAIRAAAPPS